MAFIFWTICKQWYNSHRQNRQFERFQQLLKMDQFGVICLFTKKKMVTALFGSFTTSEITTENTKVWHLSVKKFQFFSLISKEIPFHDLETQRSFASDYNDKPR